MDHKTRFDRMIENRFKPEDSLRASELIGRVTKGCEAEDVRDSLVFVRDTLAMSAVVAQDIAGRKPSLSDTLAVYDRVMQRLSTVDVEARNKQRRAEAETYWQNQAEPMSLEERLAMQPPQQQ